MTRNTCPLPPGSSVWAYLRVSGDEQADRGLPIAGQRQCAQDYADRNRLLISRWFIDEARSGGSTVHRDAFNEMIDLARARPRPVDGLIIWDLKRFARNLQDSQFYKADLRRRGYTLIFLSDDIPETDFAPVYESLLEWKAEKDRADIAKDSKRGLHLLARLGYATGGVPPIGYKTEDLTAEIEGRRRRVRRWVPDPARWSAVERAWQLRAEGASLRAVLAATHLPLTETGLAAMFRNITYLGIRRCGEVEVLGAHRPMITQELFDRVQALRIARGQARKGQPWPDDHPRRANSPFLLSGLLRCGLCGAPMSGTRIKERWDSHGHHRAEWRYYICSRRKVSHSRECTLPAIKAERIESAVLDALTAEILTAERLGDLLQAANEDVAGRSAELAATRTAIQQRLSEVDRAISRLVDSIEREDSQSLRARLSEREEEGRTLQAQLAAIDRAIAGARITISRQALAQLVAGLSGILRSGDIAASRQVLRSLILRVEVTADQGTLYYTVPQQARGSAIANTPSPARSISQPAPTYVLSLTLPHLAQRAKS